MNIRITVHLPPEIETRIRAGNPDLASAVRESFLVDQFRRGLLDRRELGASLGLDRFETLALLKRQGVFDGSLSHEDVDRDVEGIDDLIGPLRP